ncbi:hypothetical protein PSPO01_06905 [Paraphaeosphaeria sporulosa]
MNSPIVYTQYGLALFHLVLHWAPSWSGMAWMDPRPSALMPTMGQVSCQTLLRLISGIVGLTYGSVGMVLWSGVGDAALSSHTAYTLYIGANAMAAFLVLQRVRLYDQKITTLRVLIVINLITLRTIDQQWWLLVTAPSLNLLLGSCILMMTATLAVCGKMGDRSDSGLDAVVGAVVWILSLQLQPLPIDPKTASGPPSWS